MSEYSKSTDLNKLWAATGTILTPSDAKITQGNIAEKPLHEYFNWWMYRNDLFNAHINQHGYPMWDSVTEYIAEKSYVMHTNGTIYRCILTHTNQAIPNATYWEIAFGDYGYSYSKAESDNLYLAKTNDLSDLSNTNTARTNLSVYSIAQVNTLTAQATETVRGTAEVATSVEARAFTSDTVMITPSKLNLAFKGGNQNLSTNGYQVFPGGLIVQWGVTSTMNNNATLSVTLPVAYTTTNFGVIASRIRVSGQNASSIQSISTTSFNILNYESYTGSGGQSIYYWWSIGY